MKKILFLSAIAVLFAACQNKSGYTVEGNITGDNFEGQKVLFEKWNDSILVPVDSTNIVDGKFTLKGNTNSPSLLFMTIGDRDSNLGTMVMAEEGTIEVKYDSIFHVSGTPLNDSFSDFNAEQRRLNEKSRGYSEQFGTATADGTMTEELEEELKAAFNETSEEAQALQYEFVKANIDNELGQYLFMASSHTFETEQQQEILALASDEYKSTKNIQRLIEKIEAKAATAVGKDFIDFSMKTPEGDDISLSDYAGKGKYVLIDFWASWCGPCINEMPNVVAAYEKYKNKGFEIVGVSLDSDKNNWIDGIKSLNMTWPQMSEVTGWETDAVELYAIQGIPHTVLLDKEGKIIAHNLRGDKLDEKLAELMN